MSHQGASVSNKSLSNGILETFSRFSSVFKELLKQNHKKVKQLRDNLPSINTNIESKFYIFRKLVECSSE